MWALGHALAIIRSRFHFLQFVRQPLITTILAASTALVCFAARAQVPSQNQIGERVSTEVDESGSHSALEVPIREEVAEQSLQRQVLVPYKLPPQPYMREILWRDALGREISPDTPAFFRDSLLQVVMRTYYLDRNNSDGTRSRAWAAGGWIAYRSGLIADLFGVHGAFYTSQKLFGPDDEGGTKLLNPEQNPLNVLGQAYGLIRLPGEQEVRGGRMLVDTPLINPQDNRMVPNTFEGVQLVTLPNGARNYDYSLGYLWTIKQRDSNDFISMSDALKGGDVTNRGAPYGMIKYRPFAGFSTAFMDYYVQDFVNTAFAQAEYSFQLPKNVPQLMIGANVIDQRSVGSNLLTGSPFQTYQVSAKAQIAYAGWTAFVAGSVTGDESKLFSPFGTKPNYTDMQQVSFDNAGEKAIGGSLAYDFGKAGVPGLSTGAWYTHGWDALNPSTGLGIPNRDELDLWIQYRPTQGPLKGFRLKTQYSDLWQDGNMRNPQSEFRFILDYTILFRN
jgi:outer membrane OprD family porin